MLDISNGDTVNKKLEAGDCCVNRYLSTNAAPAQLVEHAYLRAFSRYPSSDEENRLVQVLNHTPKADERTAVQDMYWGGVEQQGIPL